MKNAALGLLLMLAAAFPVLALEPPAGDDHSGHEHSGHDHSGHGHGHAPHGRTLDPGKLLALPPLERLDSLVSGLLDDTGDPDPRMMHLTVALLGDHPELITSLAERLDPLNEQLTPHLLTILGRTGGGTAAAERCTKRVCELLSSPHDIVRLSTVLALRALGDPSCIPHVRPFRKDPGHDVRQTVVCILGEQGDESVVPDLIDSLGDPQRIVQHQAARALGRIASPSAVAALQETLQKKDDRYLRRVAAIALCSIDSPASVKFMEETWKAPSGARLRAAALSGLVRFGDRPDALLDEALGDDETWVRERALQLRVEHRPAETPIFLAAVIRDDRHGLRKAATRLLATVPLHDLAPLCRLLGDPLSSDTRASVLLALGRAGDPGRIPRLQ